MKNKTPQIKETSSEDKEKENACHKLNACSKQLYIVIKNQEDATTFNRDILAKIILRLIDISEQVRALNTRLDIIDYNTLWTQEYLSKKR